MKNVRDYNVGKSDYAKHTIQPWDIILEYGLNYWDGDIIKRVLRTKEGEARRLDYEKIIHICKERIRQIDMIEPCFQGEQEDRDETTVFCPSEADKPTFFLSGHVFGVYAVFKRGSEWYAYVGYARAHSAHLYICLTNNAIGIIFTEFKGFPRPVILLSDPLYHVEHTSSVKIGNLGVQYEKYDYLINEGKLYRFMGLTEGQKFFKYARFDGNSNVELIKVKNKILNQAIQITCEK